jgi:hypothetical protein
MVLVQSRCVVTWLCRQLRSTILVMMMMTLVARVGAQSTAITTTTSTCAAVDACRADSTCAVCLNASAPYSTSSATANNALTHVGRGNAERRFFQMLNNTPQCQTPLYNAAMNAIHDNTTLIDGGGCGMPFGNCSFYEFDCFEAGETCIECLDSILQAAVPSDVMYSGPCNTTFNQGLLNNMAATCDDFPSCKWMKGHCVGTCATAVDMVRDGNIDQAVQLCASAGNGTCTEVDELLKACIGATELGYNYFSARCRSIPGCGACLSEMGNMTQGPLTIASGMYTGGCVPFFSSPDFEVLTLLVDKASYQLVSACSKAVYWCSLSSSTCAKCYNGEISPSDAQYPNCTALFDSYNIAGTCAPCSPLVYLINQIAVATAVVGGISTVMCLAVVTLIIAYAKDRYSLRNRILLNLMIANVIYSSATAIPFNLLSVDIDSCGQRVMSYQASQFGRAWWFGGKYAMVCLEMFILGWSIFALTRGERHLSWWWEAALHSACVLVGIVVFVGFYVRVGQIERDGFNAATYSAAHSGSISWAHLNTNDDADDVSPGDVAHNEYTSANEEYGQLLATMLQVWVALLGVAIVMWLYMRRLFVRLLSAWRTRLTEAEAEWNRDLWAPDQQGERATKLRFLTIAKESYEEVARPLELFVIVFILFGIPATMMATTYCANNSVTHYGYCDEVCELVLAFRSMVTVFVYFARREHRAELADVRTMWKRLRARVAGWCSCLSIHSRGGSSGVRFRSMMLEEVLMIPRNDHDGDGAGENDAADDNKLSLGGDIVAASVPYRPFADETEM